MVLVFDVTILGSKEYIYYQVSKQQTRQSEHAHEMDLPYIPNSNGCVS